MRCRLAIESSTIFNWQLKDPIVGIGAKVFVREGFGWLHDGEIFRSLESIVEHSIFSFGKVEKLVPVIKSCSHLSIVILERAFQRVDRFHLGVQLWIFHIEWPEYQITRTLDDRIIARENVERTVLDISRSKLRTSNCHLDVVTGSNEDARLDRTNKEGAVVASVDSYLSDVIK